MNVVQPTRSNAEAYARTIAGVEAAVAELAQVLPGVTFGYIGNADLRHDSRTWYVFLPHPGRVGTADDRLGGFRTGDVAGARHTWAEVYAATRVARNLASNRAKSKGF